MMIIAMVAKTTGSLKSIMHENAVIHADSGKLVIHHPVLFVHKEISKQYLLFLNDSMAILKGFKEIVCPNMTLLPNQQDLFSCKEHKRRYFAERLSCSFPVKVDGEQGPPLLDNSFCAPCEDEKR